MLTGGDAIKKIQEASQSPNLRFDLSDINTEIVRANPSGGLSFQQSRFSVHASVAEWSYNSYNKSLDSREIVSKALCVAVMARAADQREIKNLQSVIMEYLSKNELDNYGSCRKCHEITFSYDNIRRTLFPEMASLRTDVNKEIIHKLDNPDFSEGLSSIPFKLAFDYCKLVFEELLPFSFGGESFDIIKFSEIKCKNCK